MIAVSKVNPSPPHYFFLLDAGSRPGKHDTDNIASCNAVYRDVVRFITATLRLTPSYEIAARSIHEPDGISDEQLFKEGTSAFEREPFSKNPLLLSAENGKL